MFILCVSHAPYFTLALLSGLTWLPWTPGAYRARASLVPIPVALVGLDRASYLWPFGFDSMVFWRIYPAPII